MIKKRNSNSWTAYRLNPQGRARSLIHVRSCGYYDVPPGWRDHERVKDFLELFWCIKGELNFCCGNDHWTLASGDVCFYLPGDLHLISAGREECEYCWLTVDGPDVRNIIDAFQIERPARHSGKCPSLLFCQLRDHILGHAAAGELLAGATAYEIITRSVAGEASSSDRIFHAFAEYVVEKLADPEASVEECARRINCHRSTLTRCVKRAAGLSPVEYLLAARLREALTLLKDSGCSIKEIAGRCGFSDPGYFARVIQQHYGVSPGALR